jgi:uncharacterized protein with NRDE domain
MCLIAFAWQAHTDYPLVVVANRDEFYARPTQRADFWEDHPQIFGGRDLSAGGSWLAISRSGRLAALTNYRDPQQNNPAARSRGALVSDFLLSEMTAQEYAASIRPHCADYNGFNLILSDTQSLVYFNNQTREITTLKPGVYALSNALLDTPWPKTCSARDKLRHWLKHPTDARGLLPLLNDTQPAEDNQLPATGIPFEIEKALSAQFIQLDNYGTRSSTALLIDQHANAEFYEQSFVPQQGIVHHQLSLTTHTRLSYYRT